MYKSPTQDSCKMLQNVSFSKIFLAQVFDHHMQHLNNTCKCLQIAKVNYKCLWKKWAQLVVLILLFSKSSCKSKIWEFWTIFRNKLLYVKFHIDQTCKVKFICMNEQHVMYHVDTHTYLWCYFVITLLHVYLHLQADVLLDRNCSSLTVNNKGETALDLACRYGHVHVCSMVTFILVCIESWGVLLVDKSWANIL